MRNFVFDVNPKSLIGLSQIGKERRWTFEISMLQGVTNRYSLGLFEFQHFLQKLSNLEAHKNKLLKSLFNILGSFSHIFELVKIFCLKQLSAGIQKVEDTTNAKHITFLIIVPLVDHLRGNVSNGASDGSVAWGLW